MLLVLFDTFVCVCGVRFQVKTRTVSTLQAKCRKFKAELEASKLRSDERLKAEVGKAKKAGSAAAARHLAFIDRLLGDKTALAKRVEEMEGERAAADASWQAKMKALQQRQAVDLRKAKDQWAAAEKVHRAPCGSVCVCVCVRVCA